MDEPMFSQNDRPATKADVAELRGELRGEVGSLRAGLRRLTIEIVQVKEDVSDIRRTMLTKRDLDPVNKLVDLCLRQFDDYSQRQATQGELLGRFGSLLDDHERRIARLEGNA